MKIIYPIHIPAGAAHEGNTLPGQKEMATAVMNNTLPILKNDKQAIAFLTRSNEYINLQLPDLMVFDISLPKTKDPEAWLYAKKDKKLKLIPFIISTTSPYPTHERSTLPIINMQTTVLEDQLI